MRAINKIAIRSRTRRFLFLLRLLVDFAFALRRNPHGIENISIVVTSRNISSRICVPSVPGSLVHVEVGEGYADRAEELVDPQEVTMQGGEDDLGGVTLFRNQQLAFLMPLHVLDSLLLHRRLVLFLAESDCHEAVVGLCAKHFIVRRFTWAAVAGHV